MIKSLLFILKSFSLKEKVIFIISTIFLFVSATILLIKIIDQNTTLLPTSGGSFTEGVVGQPAFINPVLAKPGTIDDDLTTLLFANLLDLSENIKPSKDFKTWTVRLKESARWQDETPITSDDIIFTIQTIQNPDTLSPLFNDWQNIKVSRISEKEIFFELPSPYSLFENLLKKLRPIPKKIFADIAPANIKLSSYNLEPFVSGPFSYEKVERRKDGFITAYYLKINPAYRSINSLPYLKRFNIRFFENEEGLINAYNQGIIDGFLITERSLIKKISINYLIEEIPTSKYYALFLNPNANSQLASLKIRKALQIATNINAIINKEFEGYAFPEFGPIPSTLSSYDKSIEKYFSYDLEQARNLISDDGWTFNEETASWEKTEKDRKEILAVSIKTPDTPLLIKIAQEIKEDWNKIGIKTEIIKYDTNLIGEEVIKTRDYQILLFGNVVSFEPDLFSFWHSSEKFHPGLNLALYENSTVDKLINDLRKIAVNDPKRKEILSQIQREIVTDVPVIFLVSPRYFYIHKTNLSGIIIDFISLNSDRFQKINQWYVKTKRAIK